ncbi:hypothetical protein Peur_068674 [Populus x canadensis]
MKLYKGSMRKMGSSSAEDIPAMQGDEGLLHFQWLDRNLNAVEDHSFKSEVFPSATLLLYLVVWRSSLMKEEPDASTPFQVFEDMLEDNISSRIGNLVVPDLGADVMSDVTSLSGPVGPRDVMINVAGSSGDPDEGDILKLDLIMPLIETLSLEEGLTSHLPEV